MRHPHEVGIDATAAAVYDPMCRVELLNVGSTQFLQQFDDPLTELL